MISYQIPAGSVDQEVTIRIVDSVTGLPETGVVFNTAGLDLQYRRSFSANVAITEATLAALTTAHSDGGFLHIGNGYYTLHLPDAALAAGAENVIIHGTVPDMIVMGAHIQLTNFSEIQDIVDAVLDEANASHVTAGSVGLAISTGGTAAGLITSLATKVLKYFQLLFRKDAAIATDNATELAEINADEGTGAGAAANTTDSNEAIRDNMPTVSGGIASADVKKINSVTITGDGSAGDKFGVT